MKIKEQNMNKMKYKEDQTKILIKVIMFRIDSKDIELVNFKQFKKLFHDFRH